MREDILFGLKNAVDKGVKIDDAVRSFVSAGYNAEEVNAAAKELSSGTASAIIYPEEKHDEINEEKHDEKKKTPVLPKISLQSENKAEGKVQEKKKDSRKIIIIAIIVSAFIILTTIGYLIYALLT